MSIMKVNVKVGKANLTLHGTYSHEANYDCEAPKKIAPSEPEQFQIEKVTIGKHDVTTMVEAFNVLLDTQVSNTLSKHNVTETTWTNMWDKLETLALKKIQYKLYKLK